jgi:long-subunit acyl-CoA synthetase (AMP-forming)
VRWRGSRIRVEAGALARVAAEWYGPTVALTGQGETQTFDELFRSANRAASGLLSLGLQRGDRFGVLARNTPEVVQAWLGMEAHNLVRVVLHSHFGRERLNGLAGLARSRRNPRNPRSTSHKSPPKRR